MAQATYVLPHLPPTSFKGTAKKRGGTKRSRTLPNTQAQTRAARGPQTRPDEALQAQSGDDPSPTRSTPSSVLSTDEDKKWPHDPERCAFISDDPCETKRPMRNMVSHYFGRNKSGIKSLPKEARVLMCRPHYQRSSWAAGKERKLAKYTHIFVKRQLNAMKAYYASIEWTIGFQKNLRRELGYVRNDRDRDSSESAAAQSARKQACRLQKYSEKELRWIRQNLEPHLGNHKSTTDVERFLKLTESLPSEDFPKLPEFELIPVKVTERETDSSEHEQ